MNTQESFLAEVKRFINHSGLSASSFGKLSIGDPNLVLDLRTNNRSPQLRTIERIRKFMDDYKIPRPKSTDGRK